MQSEESRQVLTKFSFHSVTRFYSNIIFIRLQKFIHRDDKVFLIRILVNLLATKFIIRNGKGSFEIILLRLLNWNFATGWYVTISNSFVRRFKADVLWYVIVWHFRWVISQQQLMTDRLQNFQNFVTKLNKPLIFFCCKKV